MGKVTLEFNWDEFVQLDMLKAKPTKVAKKESHYFAVMSDYDESSRLEYMTQSARDAFETKELLEAMNKDCNRSYRVVMQNNGCIVPCKGADWDID